MTGTLEEKIMSLQAFKRHVAASVVNQQNASLATMNTQASAIGLHQSAFCRQICT